MVDINPEYVRRLKAAKDAGICGPVFEPYRKAVRARASKERLLREREDSPYPEKWVRSIDAYRVLCPEDPMGLEGMRHRAIDDAVMEGGGILRKLPCQTVHSIL